MIHLLEITADLTPDKLKKQARKLAMTGGYELTLSSDLGSHDLTRLAEMFIEELEKNYPEKDSRRRASNAARVLKLVSEHPATDQLLIKRLKKLL
ncbi:MAG: hypothetical protein D6719_07180 [Candidatus Dadabacteria bacterium]|nr:MAG: hypothetical protein D6719_07180 [Candidatus Dadabacteria bacterium]